MVILSLNIHGLGDTTQRISLKNPIIFVHTFIIFIQKAMSVKTKAIEYFLSIYPNWHIVDVDSCGLLGGIVALWDPIWAKLRAYKFFASILFSRYIRGISFHLYFLNIYTQCRDR